MDEERFNQCRNEYVNTQELRNVLLLKTLPNTWTRIRAIIIIKIHRSNSDNEEILFLNYYNILINYIF